MKEEHSLLFSELSTSDEVNQRRQRLAFVYRVQQNAFQPG
jgi:hypothetical protein